jgi:hypothetical protein
MNTSPEISAGKSFPGFLARVLRCLPRSDLLAPHKLQDGSSPRTLIPESDSPVERRGEDQATFMRTFGSRRSEDVRRGDFLARVLRCLPRSDLLAPHKLQDGSSPRTLKGHTKLPLVARGRDVPESDSPVERRGEDQATFMRTFGSRRSCDAFPDLTFSLLTNYRTARLRAPSKATRNESPRRRERTCQCGKDSQSHVAAGGQHHFV